MPRIPLSLRVAWTKITFSNLTLVYFVYSVGHFVVQLSIQAKVFSINDDAERFLFRIVNTAGTADKTLPYLDGQNLRLCSQIPPSMDFDIDDCPVIWNEATGGPDRRFAAMLDTSPSPTTLSSLLSSVLPSSTPLPLPSSTSAVPATTTRAVASSGSPVTATSTSTSTFTVTPTSSRVLPSTTPISIPTPTPTVGITPPAVEDENENEDEDEDEDEDGAESVDSPESSDSLGESDGESADSLDDDDDTPTPGPITLPGIVNPPQPTNSTSNLLTVKSPRRRHALPGPPSRHQAGTIDKRQRGKLRILKLHSSNGHVNSRDSDDTLSNKSHSESRSTRGRGGVDRNRVSRRELEELGVPAKRADPRVRILRWLGGVRSASGSGDVDAGGVELVPAAASSGEGLSRRQGRSRSRASTNDSDDSLDSDSINSIDTNSSRGRLIQNRVGRVRTRLTRRQRNSSISSDDSRNSVDSVDSLNTDSSRGRGRGRGRVDAIVLKRGGEEGEAHALYKRQRAGSVSSNDSRESNDTSSSRGRRFRVRVRKSGVAPLRTAVVSSSFPVDGAEAVDEFLERRQDQSSNSAFRVFTVQLPDGGNTEVNEVCLLALNYPLSVIRNTRREDIVFIAFQFWVLGMSIVALLNESIPYIVASFLTHAMAMAWNAFQLVHTAHFRAHFNKIITNGACAGVNLLPKYWDARRVAEIPGLVFNVVGLVVFGALSWKLFRLFGWQTFRRMGASRVMSRIYKLVLSLGVAIQLGVFFIVVQVSLWLDQLFNCVVHDSAPLTKLHKGTAFVTLFLLIPWLITGWVAVKRELRIPMVIFIVFAILYIVECGVMFFSLTFRFTFLTWRFFSIMASTSFALACLIVLLGIACYLNFNHGFAAYLKGVKDRPPSLEDASHGAAVFDYGSSPYPYGHSEKSSEKHLFSDDDLRGPSPLPTTFILNPSAPPTQEYPFDLTPYTLKQNRDSDSTQGSNSIIGSSYFGIRGLQRSRTNSTGPDWSFVTPGVGAGVVNGGAPVAFPRSPPAVVAADTRSSSTSAVMEHYRDGALNRQQSTKTYTTWESFVVGSEEPAVPEAAVGSNRTTAEFGHGGGHGGIQRSA